MRWRPNPPLPIERLQQMAPDGDYRDHRLRADPFFWVVVWYAVCMVIVCWLVGILAGLITPWTLPILAGLIIAAILGWLVDQDRRDL